MPILTVGTGQQYARIADAVAASHDGDTLQVQAGAYLNDFATVNTKITIEGVGGMVRLIATQAPPDSKAILTTNTDVTLDHIEFSGAQVADGNGAGVRYQGGNLVVTNSYFHDNQDGILGGPAVAGAGSITIRSSEFAHNGVGDGLTHNLYAGDVGSLVIDQSYFHDAVVGHEIKSRAERTTITNSRIQDGPTGTASYSIDLPNGGIALIQGNVIQQGPASKNPAMIVFGEEGGLRASNMLRVASNTILNDLASPSISAVWNATAATADVTGNAIYGLPASRIGIGTVTVSGNTALASEPALVTTSPWASAAGLILNVAEDAWQGDAQFTISVDGRQVGGMHTASASHAAGQTQAVAVDATLGAGAHRVGISFINDAWGGTASTDRNLFLSGATLDGQAIAGSAATLLSNGTAYFNATVGGQPPRPPSTLTLNMSEDAWQGDAQFTLSVDGQKLGGLYTASASHAAGQSQAITISGIPESMNLHDIAVSFINDAWGGTPSTDRNLYVDAVQFDGQSVAGGTAVLYSNGTQHFTATAPANWTG